MAKRIRYTDIIGQQGVNLIERIVLEMGSLWHPTKLEAGIDGFIELRQPNGDVTNFVVQVQSRATSTPFRNETAAGLTYYCDAKELDYWLGGNAPVILIHSRPSTGEAYWVNIKAYFADPVRRKSHRIDFDKQRDRFDAACRDRIFQLGVPTTRGLYLAPLPGSEELTTNLVPVSSYGAKIHHARLLGDRRDAWSTMCQVGRRRSDWIAHGDRLYSFAPMSDPAFAAVCDLADQGHFPSTDWALAEELQTKYRFTDLLMRALQEKTHRDLGFLKRGSQSILYFRAPRDCVERVVTYRSFKVNTSKRVFCGYGSAESNSDDVMFYKHAAFEARFRRFDQAWYLEVNPTFRYTSDGMEDYSGAEALLKGLKRMEHNQSIAGHLHMWAEFLRTGDRVALFDREDPYPFLSFGELVRVEVPSRLEDKHWSQSEESKAQASEETADPMPLFT